MIDTPRSLKNEDERMRRLAMLSEPHMAPLAAYVCRLRQDRYYVPDFDPLDGGINAKILFLFEKPGPKTAPPSGSGFISRNNNDATAAATFEFMVEAGLCRKNTITWNTIPGWNGEIKIGPGELAEGLSCLDELLRLLPKLKVVVLVGKKAAKAQLLFCNHGLPTILSDHPSPKVRSTHSERWKAIPEIWSKAHEYL